MNGSLSAWWAACIFLSAATQISAKSILVFAPHYDDEILGFGGVIRTAIEEGDMVQVVVATSDLANKQVAVNRMGETISGMSAIGLDEKYISFLGYLETRLEEFYNSPDNTVHSSLGVPSWSQTWGLPDHPDYHTQVFGVPADYTKANVRMDIETIIKGALADDIYVSGFFDTNRDHRFLNKFVSEAIVKTKKQIPTYSPRMHEFAIHGAQDGGEAAWPVRDPDDVLLPFTKPDQFENWTPLIWENTDTFTWSTMERFPVPQSMSGLPRSTNNLKHAAIGRYSTALYTENPNDPVVPSYFFAFAKYDEVFHSRDFSNLAYLATASAGSEDPQWGQTAAKVADGVIDGNQATNQDLYGWDNQHEWVAGNPAQRWVQLTWPRTYKIDRINLYDRPSPWERVLSGTLSFSDGTSINVVDALPDKGGMHPVVFTPKTVSWVRFTISTFSGQKPGLAEVEVFPVNTARQATVSVSSQSPDQGGAKAIDGIRDGFPHDYKREWAANGQSVNAWIQLGFPSKTIDKIVLSDRPNNWERIQRATLTFSSGSPIVIGGLSNNGTGNVINFRPRATTFVRMTVNSALGGTTGLSEFEVYEALNSASSNYALYASTSCSSENMKTGQICKKAVDGIKDGFPGDFTKEWATESQLVGSWIQLNWPQNYPLTRIVLYDRPSSFESISGGTLTFSNGSFINVSSLPNNGSAKTINFSTKNVNWVRFTMSGAQGQNAGLSEMEAF